MTPCAPNTDCLAPDSRSGICVYCFARAEAVRHFGGKGLDREPIEAFSLHDIAAIVSRVSLDEFAAAAEQAGEKGPMLLANRACRHEQIIEAVMERSPVLPVRFGAVFSSLQALEGFLTRHRERIASFLDEMTGKEEWAVKGSLDAGRFGDWLSANDPILAQRRRNFPEAPGARYFEEKRMRLEVQLQVRQRARQLAVQIQQQLEPLTIRQAALPLRSVPGGKSQLVFHAALLISKETVSELFAQIRKIQAEESERGLTLECTGPWPPYHFCPALSESSA